jgi:hypothetical protein
MQRCFKRHAALVGVYVWLVTHGDPHLHGCHKYYEKKQKNFITIVITITISITTTTVITVQFGSWLASS